MTTPILYFLIADDTFTLKLCFPRPQGPAREAIPYEQKIFEYTSHIIKDSPNHGECSQYIVTRIWLYVKTGIKLNPDRATAVVVACIILHNLMQKYILYLQDINMD